MGYVVGGLSAGVLADTIELSGTIAVVAVLTALSGIWVAVDLREGRKSSPTIASAAGV